MIGDVYRLRSRAALVAFDRYEGGVIGMRRFVRRRAVAMSVRRRSRVWLYEYRGPVRAGMRIPHGDYRNHVETT